MKIVAVKLNEDYSAGMFERLYEERIAASLKQQGIELVRIVKFGNDENKPECELKYDVYVRSISREKDCLLENELGLMYINSHDCVDTYTMSFSWDMEKEESMELLYSRLTTVFGIKSDVGLYKDTMERLKRGICWGALEEVVEGSSSDN